MSDTQFDDLKQFITATVSQTEERLQTQISQLRNEVTDGFAGIGDAIEQIHQQTEVKHTRRLR